MAYKKYLAQQLGDVSAWATSLKPLTLKKKLIIHCYFSDSLASSSSTGVQTVLQRFNPRENQHAIPHFPTEVGSLSFIHQDGRPIQIIDATNRNPVILDTTNRNQVILDAANRNTAMIQAVNRNQIMIAESTRNQTLNLQKINYTIQDSHGNQHPGAPQNYQIFQADTYHQNVLGQHTDHTIYHIEKPNGELIPLRSLRVTGDVNMQIPTGY